MYKNYRKLFSCFENQPIINAKSGHRYMVNSLTDHANSTSPELLSEAVSAISSCIDTSTINKLVGEEEKGGFLTACVAMNIRIPFTLAKQYPIHFPGEVGLSFKMAYSNHMPLYLNGVCENDKVVIIDDMIDSGGTLVALYEAVKQKKAHVVDIVTLVERVEKNGRDFIKEKTGIVPKSVIKLDTSSERSRIIDFSIRL